MGTIRSVQAHVLEATAEQSWDAGKAQPVSCVLVEVHSDSGERGWGEAIARRGPLVTATIISELLAPVARGREVADLGAIWRDCCAILSRWGHHSGFLLEAVSGLDIALWDLRAREAGLSLRAFLPGGGHRRIATYASSVYFQPSVEDAAALAVELARAGHSRIKLKLGYPDEEGGVRRDVATVRAVRAALPEQVELLLDARCVYTLARAREFVEAVRDLPIGWLEEPFPADDVPAYAALAAMSPIPLAAGESLFSASGFRDLLASGALGYAQPDVARCGGITGTLRVMDLCAAHRIPVALHTGLSGGVNNLVSLHLAAGSVEPCLVEHMVVPNPLRDMFAVPLPIPVDGVVEFFPGGPGLGFDVDLQRLPTARQTLGAT